MVGLHCLRFAQIIHDDAESNENQGNGGNKQQKILSGNFPGVFFGQ
jgi:hypothetical protein